MSQGLEVTTSYCNISSPPKLSPLCGLDDWKRVVLSIPSCASTMLVSIWEIIGYALRIGHVYFILDVLLASCLVIEMDILVVTKDDLFHDDNPVSKGAFLV